jgi:hypothetical protein
MPSGRISSPFRLALMTLGLVAMTLVMPTDSNAAGPTKRDLYFRGGYERQIDGRTCTAASTSMMLNFIASKDLGLSQRGILDYEQRHDALNDRTQRGSDPLGWSNALTHFADRTGRKVAYAWEAFDTENAALKRAARQIAVTGMPVGLEIWNGRHAVVMTGYEATANPRDGEFRLTNIWVSDPYGAQHLRYAASRSPLNKYLERDATRQYTKAWYGKFVIIVPQG